MGDYKVLIKPSAVKELYQEVQRIISKTVGVVGQLRDTLKLIPGIGEAYLYGSFARNQQDAASDIDILAIGEPKTEEVEGGIRKLERRLHREINYTLLSEEEFLIRRARKDPFLRDIWQHKRINLLGAA